MADKPFYIQWDASGLRPAAVCMACEAGVPELCDGFGPSSSVRVSRSTPCGCARLGHEWCKEPHA